MHNKRLYLGLALLWTFIVSVLSLITIGDVGSSIPISNKDKYVHFTFYFIFVNFWFLFAKKTNKSKQTQWIVLFSAIVYGILLEICQGVFTASRTPDVMDVLANSLGAIFGFIFFKIVINKYKTTP
ncbi:VanZ family protein [Flavobacterium sp.]|uniref:VanZ family protein n=1 Tax=Flavobacterium sp. TaxID=239 RepID=UPI003BC49B16